MTTSTTTTKKPRGFAAMSKERQLELARMGGRAVKAENRSFAKDRAFASEMGRKGGKAVAASKRSFYTDRKLAQDAGTKGQASRQTSST